MRRTSLVRRCLTPLLVSSARVALGQEIHGAVPPPPESPGRAVIVVTLLDSAGQRLNTAVADGKGAFHFRLPGAGAYALRIDALGSRGHVTPPFLVDSAQSLSFTHVWTDPVVDTATATAAPPGAGDSTLRDAADGAQRLRGVRIEATPEPERFFGLDTRMLAIKPIGRERLDSLTSRISDFASVLRLLGVPGLRIFGAGNGACAIAPGSIIRPSGNPCSHVVIDGARMPPPFDLNMINPQTIERLIVLRPIEATQFYGTGDGNGMILIFTKIGPASRATRR